jgi:hypothetical protein
LGFAAEREPPKERFLIEVDNPADRTAARIVRLACFDLAQLDELERHHPGV